MYFQQKQTIRGLALRIVGAITFNFDSPKHLEVILTRQHEVEADPSMQVVSVQVEGWEANQREWPAREELLCIVKLQKETSPKISHLMGMVAQGKMSPSPEDVSFPIMADDYRSAATYVKQASQIPEALNTFLTETHKEMYDYGVRTLQVLRWRANATGPHNIVYGCISEFSLDGTTWFSFPLPPGFYIEVERDIRISEELGSEIVNFVSSGNNEPHNSAISRCER
jgi:hypothetical protein